MNEKKRKFILNRHKDTISKYMKCIGYKSSLILFENEFCLVYKSYIRNMYHIIKVKKESSDIYNEIKMLMKIKKRKIQNVSNIYSVNILPITNNINIILISMEYRADYNDIYYHLNIYRVFQEDLAVIVLKKVIYILQDLLSIKLCYTDIKDENILLNIDTHDVCIIDFEGCFPLKKSNILLGTDYCLPPEVYHEIYVKNVEQSPRDIYKAYPWLLGSLLIRMIDDNSDIQEGIKKINTDKSVSECCLDFISKCMENIYEKRITFGEMLKHPLLKN